MTSHESGMLTITVTEVHRVNRGTLLALASVMIDVDGIQFVVNGVQVRRQNPKTGLVTVDLPSFRGPNGAQWVAIELPEEVRVPLGDAVLAVWKGDNGLDS